MSELGQGWDEIFDDLYLRDDGCKVQRWMPGVWYADTLDECGQEHYPTAQAAMEARRLPPGKDYSPMTHTTNLVARRK